MRAFCLSLLIAIASLMTVARPVAVASSNPTVHHEMTMALQTGADVNPVKDINVDVNVNHGGVAWYRSPVWVAIGVIAVVLLVVIVAMISRGGGTTIVKE